MKFKWFIYTFNKNTTFAIVRVKVIDNDSIGNIVISPVDGNGHFINIPFDSMIVDCDNVFDTKKEALISLRKTLKIALYNVNDFIEKRLIDEGGCDLHIPDKIIRQ